MIRDFSPEDKEELVKIVKQGIYIDEEDIINYITGEDIKIVVFDFNFAFEITKKPGR